MHLLVSQGTDMHNQLSDIAASARLSRSTGLIQYPNLTGSDMILDRERHKSKTVYLGDYGNVSIEL